MIFFGTTFFLRSWVLYHEVHFQVRHKSKASFEKQFLYSRRSYSVATARKNIFFLFN